MCKANLNIWQLVWLLVLVLAGSAGALTHYVSPGQSIQAAINDANDGDEIEVAPGTYYEAINFNGKAVRLYSSDGPEVTTIDGTGQYHVVQCVNGEDVNTILEGFTITGGNANGIAPDDRGGGMYNNGSSPTVTYCNFSNNMASNNGGGMYNFGGKEQLIVGYDFENIAPNQGVDVPAPPSFVMDVLVTASDLGIVQGSAVYLLTNPYSNGVVGGQQISFSQGIPSHTYIAPAGYNFFEFSVAAAGSPVEITSISFSTGHNDADDKTPHDGIIEYRTPGGDLLGSDTFVIQYGLALAPVIIVPSTTLVVGAQPTFFRIRFNEVIYGSNSYTTQLRIDDVYLNLTNGATVTNCTFNNNQAGVNGGGMYNYDSSAILNGCTFIGNTAGSDGGGIFNNVAGTVITQCRFCNNSSNYIAGPISGSYFVNDTCIFIDGDVDGDGDVDFEDLAIVCGNWLAKE